MKSETQGPKADSLHNSDPPRYWPSFKSLTVATNQPPPSFASLSTNNMPPKKSKRSRPDRKYSRNLKGLLSKCYKYGKLNGVELALYVDYTQKGSFVSYETESYSCHSILHEKVGRAPNIL